jgi:hypothetical protein
LASCVIIGWQRRFAWRCCFPFRAWGNCIQVT